MTVDDYRAALEDYLDASRAVSALLPPAEMIDPGKTPVLLILTLDKLREIDDAQGRLDRARMVWRAAAERFVAG
jgi:hypothetical protein